MSKGVPLVDDPFWRDWLFWVVFVFATVGLIVGQVVWHKSAWLALSQWLTAFGVPILILGSLRQLVRGYREPSSKAGRSAGD